MKTVTTQSEVEQNILQFNAEIESSKKPRPEYPALELVNNIPRFRSWFYIFNEREKKYSFAPSKYIGYANINAKIYNEKKHSELDGRQTETALASWYEVLSPTDPLHEILSDELGKFCNAYGKKPNNTSRINIIKVIQNEDSIENDVVNLIWKIYVGLENKNKAILKTKINKYKP